jgi:AcrR family transcriptional regulator
VTAAVEHLGVNGLGDASLRELAAAIGTSHRMLIYHFGSRTGLLAEVVAVVEREQREALAELGRSGRSPSEVGLAMWERLASPSLAPQERLFFELYARGLQGDPAAAALLGEAIEAWLGPLAELYQSFGFAPEAAAAEARLGLAVTRGLLLDLLASGQRSEADAAMRAYMDGLLARLG